jgi:hypothetical protein
MATSLAQLPEVVTGDETPFLVGQDRLRLAWRLALCLLGVQLAGMLVFSTVQYQRFNLTFDFATYSQAWVAIAHGHMSPFSSTLASPFWRNDFELLMWPMALFYWVYPHTVTLLWLQDLAVVAGELVALVWVRDALKRTGQIAREAVWILGFVTLLILITPWSWFTIGFDFHLEPFATVFALLAARDIWAGRNRWLIVWVPLTLASCAAAGALLIIAVGLAALLGRGRPRAAVVMVMAGVGWLVLTESLGGMRFGGLSLSSMYGYLSGNASGHMSLVQLLEGLVIHPTRASDMFGSHLGYVLGYIISGGVIGLWSRWGLLPAVFVLIPSALNANTDYIHFAQAFQSWPAVLFLVVGSAFVLERLATKAVFPRRVMCVFGGCTVALAVGVTAFAAGQIPEYLKRVSPAAASELAKVKRAIPVEAEVISSQGVMGRFGADRAAYAYWADDRPERYSIAKPSVVFLMAPTQGTAEGNPADTRQAIHYIASNLRAKVLVQGSGIWAFDWTPKAGTSSVVLP